MQRSIVCRVAGVLCGIVLLGVATLHAQDQPTRNVAIVIWNGAEILDWAGPSEVFVAATYQGAVGDKRPFHVYTVSLTREPIVSQTFVDVIPDYDIENAPKPDIIVLPGGGTNSVLNNAAFLKWATTAAHEAEIALSVCTGAFILGQAGLLDDKDVTTWYGATDGLAARFPKARVHEGRRFIDNGQVVTTAGVSAGIDGALHVVARLLGRDVADRTAEYMEYRWSPQSFLARQYSWLNPNADEYGREEQRASAYVRAGEYDQAIAVYEELVEQKPDQASTWSALGKACYEAEDFRRAADAYAKAAERPEGRSRHMYNAACSAARAQDVENAFVCLEAAIEAGFKDLSLLERDTDLESLRSHERYAAVRKQLEDAAQQTTR